MTDPIELTYSEELYSLPPQVVVILDKPWKNVTAEEQTLLGKILASAKQSSNSVRMMYAEKITADEFTPGSKVILFGAQLTPEIPAYEVTGSAGSLFISADPLQQLDDTKKKRLWMEIKKAFSL